MHLTVSTRLVWWLWLLLLSGCSTEWSGNCLESDYPGTGQSPYVLPYRTGETYQVIQGNCSAPERTHRTDGILRYAYDFAMPYGTPVIAARAGRVRRVVDHFTDGTGIEGEENIIVVSHDDGTFAMYVHMQKAGASVVEGQWVRQGEVVGLSGNSGRSSEPHLHFHVLTIVAGEPACDVRESSCRVVCDEQNILCETMPIALSNTGEASPRLIEGEYYQAGETAAARFVTRPSK